MHKRYQDEEERRGKEREKKEIIPCDIVDMPTQELTSTVGLRVVISHPVRVLYNR